MPRRRHLLANNEIYHLFNRSVGREEILIHKKYLNRFIDVAAYYKFPQSRKYSHFQRLPTTLKIEYLDQIKGKRPLVAIYSFALMPNHYHFLIEQLQEKGISIFIANIQNSFAKYFNLKNNRHGTLFQSPFKAKRVETDEEFLHLSRYIHLNPVTSYLIKLNDLPSYPYTSFKDYTEDRLTGTVDRDRILTYFKSPKKYFQFIENQADYQKQLNKIKHLIID